MVALAPKPKPPCDDTYVAPADAWWWERVTRTLESGLAPQPDDCRALGFALRRAGAQAFGLSPVTPTPQQLALRNRLFCEYWARFCPGHRPASAARIIVTRLKRCRDSGWKKYRSASNPPALTEPERMLFEILRAVDSEISVRHLRRILAIPPSDGQPNAPKSETDFERH
jgi:hypothetical protein